MSPEAPYPVMVYFYGGAYLSGANIMYPGHFLAARDVVVVVVNYRVGVFGRVYLFIIHYTMYLIYLPV